MVTQVNEIETPNLEAFKQAIVLAADEGYDFVNLKIRVYSSNNIGAPSEVPILFRDVNRVLNISKDDSFSDEWITEDLFGD